MIQGMDSRHLGRIIKLTGMILIHPEGMIMVVTIQEIIEIGMERMTDDISTREIPGEKITTEKVPITAEDPEGQDPEKDGSLHPTGMIRDHVSTEI